MTNTAPSKAAALLQSKVRPPVMNQTALARRLGVSQQAVSNWLSGRSVPEPARMKQLEDLLGIEMRGWFESPDETLDVETTVNAA